MLSDTQGSPSTPSLLIDEKSLLISPVNKLEHLLEYSSCSDVIEVKISGICPQYKSCAVRVWWWTLPMEEAEPKVLLLNHILSLISGPCLKWMLKRLQRLLLDPQKLYQEEAPWILSLWHPLVLAHRLLSLLIALELPTGWLGAVKYSRAALPHRGRRHGDIRPIVYVDPSVCHQDWCFAAASHVILECTVWVAQ